MGSPCKYGLISAYLNLDARAERKEYLVDR